MSKSVALQKGDVLFISDVHLGGFTLEKNLEIEKRLLSLLDFAIREKCSVCVLGDLFDYWMEYRGKWPEYGEKVLNRFSDLRRELGEPVLFITGNHDNWTGPRLADAGFDLEPEYRMMDMGGKNVMLMHGDGLKDPRFEFPRPLFHRILRNPYFLKMYQSVLPPRQGIALTRIFSRNSKKRDNIKKLQQETSHIDNWAMEMVKGKEADVLLCGHHHRPVFNAVNGGLYINLGNFYNDSTLAVYTRDGFKLVSWHADKQQFQPFKMPSTYE